MITSGCGNRLTYNVLSDVDKHGVVVEDEDRSTSPLLSTGYGVERPGGVRIAGVPAEPSLYEPERHTGDLQKV